METNTMIFFIYIHIKVNERNIIIEYFSHNAHIDLVFWFINSDKINVYVRNKTIAINNIRTALYHMENIGFNRKKIFVGV